MMRPTPTRMGIPLDFPVVPIRPGSQAARDAGRGLAECGTCGRLWNDDVITSMTPAPSARCPFEYFHKEEDA